MASAIQRAIMLKPKAHFEPGKNKQQQKSG